MQHNLNFTTECENCVCPQAIAGVTRTACYNAMPLATILLRRRCALQDRTPGYEDGIAFAIYSRSELRLIFLNC